MADDLEAELSKLEEEAPDTVETDDNGQDFGPGNPKPVKLDDKDADAGADNAEEWKPPNKDTWENQQKAWRQDRENARRAKQQLALQEQNIARIEQQVRDWQVQMLQRQMAAPPPDPFEQPNEAREWQRQQQMQQQQWLQAEAQRQQQQRQFIEQERQFSALSDAVTDYEAEFKTSTPDYEEASEFVLNAQQMFLENAGYPPEVAAQQVGAWSANVAQQMLRAGRNPAQVTYEMAQKMGYQPPSKRNGSGQSAADRLAAIQAGQNSAKTLSGGGAGKPGGTSLKQIASLDGAAFDSAMEKYLNDAIKGR